MFKVTWQKNKVLVKFSCFKFIKTEKSFGFKLSKIFGFVKKYKTFKISILGIKMSFKIKNTFKTNYFYIREHDGKLKRKYKNIKGIKINFRGENAKIIISNGSYNNCIFNLDNNSYVEIKKPHWWGIKNLTTYCGKNSSIVIDENFNCSGTRLICQDENIKMNIGKYCMFSYGVEVRTHDGHVIYDKITKHAINEPKGIIIGDNCWLGAYTMVLKGVNIANNSIIGAKSLVNKNIDEENTISAGIPAKIIKRNVGLGRERYSEYIH